MFTALTPFLGMPLFMLNGLLVVGDSLMFLLFKKRIFDFTLGTRVIPESPDHAMVCSFHFSLFWLIVSLLLESETS